MGSIWKNQKGFSAVEALLAIVIVGLIGFVGWYVYSSNKKTNDTLDQTTQSLQNTKPTNSSKKKASSNEAKPLTLEQAVQATTSVYGKLVSQWGSQPEKSFIQNNSIDFTASFVQSVQTGGQQRPLQCDANSETKPDNITYVGVSMDDKSARVNVTYEFEGQGNAYALINKVKLTAQDDKWVISGLECPSEFKG